jgi:hypothetical protein
MVFLVVFLGRLLVPVIAGFDRIGLHGDALHSVAFLLCKWSFFCLFLIS